VKSEQQRTPPGRRGAWEEIWSNSRGPDFEFRLTGPTAVLPRFLERAELPQGAALDIGCGDGAATRYLSQRFPLAIGLDFAVGAILRAAAMNNGTNASLLAADITAAPFAPDTFSFAFDRGCFNVLPPEFRGAYFRSIEGVLRRSGFLLMVARERKPTGLHPSSIRKRLELRRRRGVWLWPSESEFRRMIPPSMEVAEYTSDRQVTSRAIMVFHHVLIMRKP